MLSELYADVIVCLKNLILNANSRISQFKVVRYRFWSALSKKLMVGLYDFFECYWTATAISTRKYPVPFDPGSQAGKSPPSTAVREKEYRQWRSRWRYSQLDFQHRTGPPPIRISLF